MKKLLLVSADRFLERKCALALEDSAIFECVSHPSPDAYFDVCLWDIDTAGEPSLTDRVFTLSREGECDIRAPFTFDTLLSLINNDKSEALLECRGKVAYLRGREIRLTELEAALLTRLIEARGDFVSREMLLYDVWGGECDGGIINVYVHYLREKLEDGEKIIISSRKRGYKIEGRYIGCSE